MPEETGPAHPNTAQPDTGKPIMGNPVTRARLAVEAEVPLAQRGPGWDRHWRELEAYVESRLEWSQGE
ncbi:MAG: hypothetical protein FP826_04755 [Sphingomonadales bacterium]|nr:hypothetical protein [Sphingomonadales bacterium]MBU3991682.1 hypothetical protein [Alphaproteobacteria bacterium]